MDSPSENEFGPYQYVRVFQQRLDKSGWWHSFELPDGGFIEGSCDLAGLKNRIAQFPIPSDLRGKRVLDIGAWDGWFSFEMERRGAEVIAIDVWDNPRFRQMHRILNSRVDYRQMDVYDLDPRRIGRFDIVLFMGVLYHLKHPLLALEHVCAVTDGFAAIDSFVIREGHHPGASVENRPLMEFYETDEFGGQTDNWVGPSLPCLLAFCRTAGFARVELQNVLDYSACVVGHRRWEPETASGFEAPVLLNVFHHTNFGLNFNSEKDEYLTCWFDYDDGDQPLNLTRVRPQVGPYRVRPVRVSQIENHWQVNFKCPPGLEPGWHEVVLMVDKSPPSNPVGIAVDVTSVATTLSIIKACDGVTWQEGVIHCDAGAPVSLWAEGLPDSADRNNTQATVSGILSKISYIEPRGPKQRQINIELPDVDWQGQTVSLTIAIAGISSPPVQMRCL